MEVKLSWISEIFLCILADATAGSNPLDFEKWKASNDRLNVNFIYPMYFLAKN